MTQEREDGHPLPPDEEHGERSAGRPPSARKALFGVFVILLIAVAVGVAGVLPRLRARAALVDQTNLLAVPTVAVLRPQLGKLDANVVLPGNIAAFTDSPIYARTDGYLQKWYFDLGAHVRKGELLAVISSPEVDQQLLQARADLATEEANANLAKVNSTRYQGLLAENAVSKQDTDTFVSQAASTGAAVKSAQANVQRLQELQSFEKVYAPFDGVVTARNVDIGQLIDSGAGLQMFRIAAIRTLRVYVNVPQIYSRSALPGAPATLTLAQFPGVTFPGTLVRTADAIDPGSRTLLVEVDVDNRSGKLVPGTFAQVHMNLNPGAPAFTIPLSALIFRTEGLQVGTVVKGPKGDLARLVPVTIGRDNGKTVEILSGLDASSRVIESPPDSLVDGEAVRVVRSLADPSSGSLSE